MRQGRDVEVGTRSIQWSLRFDDDVPCSTEDEGTVRQRVLRDMFYCLMCRGFLYQLCNLEKVSTVWKQSHEYMTLGKSAGSGKTPAVLNRSTRSSRISEGLLDVPIVLSGC